jgi:hypothetical protein
LQPLALRAVCRSDIHHLVIHLKRGLADSSRTERGSVSNSGNRRRQASAQAGSAALEPDDLADIALPREIKSGEEVLL